MGYLYTLDDIRQERIPRTEDYVHMYGVLEAALEEPHFLAASLFGSLRRGDWTLRSDVDVMAVTRQADHAIAQEHIKLLEGEARRRHIRLSAHLHTVAEARRGEHPFDSSHRLTMRELVAEGLAKGVPHQWYLCPGQDIRPDMLRRLCRVLEATSGTTHRFNKIKDDRELDAWIQQEWAKGDRPMRLYIGFVRWLMWWEHQSPFPDGKEEVVEAFMKEPEFSDFHEEVDELRALDAQYDDLFEAVRNDDGIDQPLYQQSTRNIISRVLHTSVGLLSRAIGRLGSLLSQTTSQVAA